MAWLLWLLTQLPLSSHSIDYETSGEITHAVDGTPDSAHNTDHEAIETEIRVDDLLICWRALGFDIAKRGQGEEILRMTRRPLN